MKAVGIKVAEVPEIIDIPNELEALQEYVGGYIEVVQLADNALLIVNEEGKLMNLPLNFYLSRNRRVIDTIHGNVLIVGRDGEEFCDLTEEQLEFYAEMMDEQLECE